MIMIDKIKEVELQIKSGEKVYKACNRVGIKLRDFYKFRSKGIIERPMSKLTIKKATEILYKGLTEKN